MLRGLVGILLCHEHYSISAKRSRSSFELGKVLLASSRQSPSDEPWRASLEVQRKFQGGSLRLWLAFLQVIQRFFT
eukprot:g58944.t1